jgi:biopolymer transport protein ExbB
MRIIIIYSILLSALTLPCFAHAQDQSLLATYQRELAFLNAQKKSLQDQKDTIQKRYQNKVQQATSLLEKERSHLVSLTQKQEGLSQNLLEAERSLETIDQTQSVFETTLKQAQVSLSISDDRWTQLDNSVEQVLFVMDQALARLKENSEVGIKEGSFFNREGQKITGDIYQVGQIASFGIPDSKKNAAGTLVPVGEGKMQLKGEDLTQKIDKMLNNELVSTLPVFLYENTSKGALLAQKKTILDELKAGGMIAYVIVALGILAFVLILFRGLFLWRAASRETQIESALKSYDIVEVKRLVENNKTPFQRVLSKTLCTQNKEREQRESIIEESILNELGALDKFNAVILVAAAVAPLLGLLGTVTGMISTFEIITEFGTGDPKLLSTGISEALITTKLGLVVAIPTLLLGNLLGSWSGKIKLMLEREALRLSNIFEDQKLKDEQ